MIQNQIWVIQNPKAILALTKEIKATITNSTVNTNVHRVMTPIPARVVNDEDFKKQHIYLAMKKNEG